MKYVINLARRADRMAQVKKEFDRVGLTVSRFEAYDEKPGWMGCRDSHLGILSMALGTDELWIFEDDVKFLTDPTSLMREVWKQLPKDWDCIYLGGSPREEQVRYSMNLYRAREVYTTHAMIWQYRPEGAVQYIMDNASRIEKIDVFYAKEIQPRFSCFLAYPMICTQNDDKSDTCKRSGIETIAANYHKYCR